MPTDAETRAQLRLPLAERTTSPNPAPRPHVLRQSCNPQPCPRPSSRSPPSSSRPSGPAAPRAPTTPPPRARRPAPSRTSHGPSAEARFWFDAGLSTYTDQRSGLGYGVTFRNTANVSAELRYTYLLLRGDFDPSRTGATPLPEGTDYGYYEARVEARTDRRRRLAFEGELSGGQFFNGRRYGVEARASYRLQPYAALSLDAVYNYIDLPAPYAQAKDLILVGPRADVTLTKSLFVTGVAQYNSQIDNVNLNLRLQWRYAPVSDLFLVYTDNLNSVTGAVRNRAIVAKVTYWFNA